MRAVALALLSLVPAVAGAADDRLTGPAKVRGPDTLAIAGARVRFAGVLPPDESALCHGPSGASSCVDAAAAGLTALVGVGTVTCTKEHRLGHGYFFGRCRTADGTDPALALLELGLLQPDPAAAPAAYTKAADAAKAARAGLWGS